ncbi:MAG: HAMP domain-containing protein, partial [Candidatus Electrothrix sp. AUS4]|nr:HAMP domain-containing protein [Candidatus Electrothrix sp. AUS4]
MIKLNSTLFAKILSWFFLNMLLVLTALTLFFAFQPQFHLQELFGQQGSDRLRVAGMLISHDLNQAQREEWSEILARHSSINGVNFVVVLRDGTFISPNLKKLPKDILLRSQETLHHRRPGSWRERLLHRNAELSKNCPSEEVRDCPKDFLPPKWHKRPHLFIRTKDPTLYWFGTKILLFSAPQQPPVAGMLLAYSETITGNGFFFDPLPWMVVAAAVLLISVLFWIPLVRHITKPLVRMTQAAEEIAKGNFNVSINEPRADEI